MKSGFSTGNGRKDRPINNLSVHCDRFLNFAWIDNKGECHLAQFYNQTNPWSAAQMLRQMAKEIEQT